MKLLEEYVMAIDQGTTSSRALIVDRQGEVVAISQKEFKQYYPHPGWVEHDPIEIWNSVQSVIAEAFIAGDIQPQQIKALGIANQRETTVIWDKETGQPIYNAIVWQSRQTSHLAQELQEAGHTDWIHQKTGLVIDAYFSATKIRWILDQVPGAQERAEQGELLFGTIDTWIAWQLSDGQLHITDYTNASRTMLFNLQTLTWDQEILDLLNIPRQLLPKVVSNSEIYGYASNFYFMEGRVPITSLIGDQQAALFGQLAVEPGMIKSTYGTGAFIVMNVGSEPKWSTHELLSTIGYVIDDQVTYALEGSIFVAGSALQWLQDELGLIESVSQTQALAMQAMSDDEVYVVPAFTGLGAPYWEPQARGSIFGLTRGSTQADIVKATLQSIAYQVRDVIDTMEEDANIAIQLLKVDGGSTQNDYLMQFQADLLNKQIIRANHLETTALGVAYLAGLAVGFWEDIDQLKQLSGSGAVYEPEMEEARRQQLYQGWQAAVQATQLFAQEPLSDGQ